MSTPFDKESGSLSKVDQELVEQEKAPLLQEIGDLTIQLKWLKKSLTLPIDQKRQMIDLSEQLSVLKQCELLDIPRSTYYHTPAEESEFKLELINISQSIRTLEVAV